MERVIFSAHPALLPPGPKCNQKCDSAAFRANCAKKSKNATDFTDLSKAYNLHWAAG
jgi:hypothetical protein